MATDLAFELEGSRRNVALAIPLHDGCDLLDVIGRRLQAQVSAPS